MKRVLSLGLLCLLSFGAQAFTAAAPAKEPSSLKQGFQAPPSDVRPLVACKDIDRRFEHMATWFQ
jgi:hypothetical protein